MTTPSGLLKWGQAGIYDAVHDREVIAAVTRNRTGLVWPAIVHAGTGLNIIIDGGWLGVASCGDRTSAVVGARVDNVVQATPGPASGSRADLVWCDVFPDDASWQLVVIPASAAAGRPGIPLAYITAPANATLSAAMGIRPADATLERRLLASQFRNDTRTATAGWWATADTVAWAEHTAEPGQWYRVRFTATSIMAVTGSLDLHLGVGWHPIGAPDPSGNLGRAVAVAMPRLNAATAAEVEWVFRHPVDAAPSGRSYDGRIWLSGSGSYRVNARTDQGAGLGITVEDLGS